MLVVRERDDLFFLYFHKLPTLPFVGFSIFFCFMLLCSYMYYILVAPTSVFFLQACSSFDKLEAGDTSGTCPCLEYGFHQKRRNLSENCRWILLRNRFVQGFYTNSFPWSQGEVGKKLMTLLTVAVFGHWK